MTVLLLKAALCLLAGLANSGMDAMTHHYSQSVFRFWDQQYWPPLVSWQNKYHRPWYIPVDLTDGWHLLKGIFLLALVIAVALPSEFLHWYWNLLFCRVVFGIGFEIGYKGLWLKK